MRGKDLGGGKSDDVGNFQDPETGGGDPKRATCVVPEAEVAGVEGMLARTGKVASTSDCPSGCEI